MASDMHRVGGGFAVRFTLTADRIDVEWSPRLPTKREMRRVLPRYRAARDAFVAALAATRGVTALVVEMQH